jgi:uncharacterized protein YgfB (UPF0149 family)
VEQLIGEIETENKKKQKKKDEGKEKTSKDAMADIVESKAEEEEDKQEEEATYEKVISPEDYVSKFASLHIVKAYAVMLKSYKTNSVALNGYITAMFKRLVETEWETLFFQVRCIGKYS